MSGIPGRMSTSLRGSEARVFATFYERPLLKLKSKTNDIAGPSRAKVDRTATSRQPKWTHRSS